MRGRKLIAADESTILSKLFFDPIVVEDIVRATEVFPIPPAPVRATLPSALNMINASSVGKLVQLVTASRLILNHEGRVDPMKDECHYQIKH